MRLLTLVALLLAGAAVAGGIALFAGGNRYEFTDCASGGSASQTVVTGTYLMRVTDADIFLCYAATCASGGEKFPSGTVMMLSVGSQGQAMSCRSSASTGDIILTAAN